MSPPLYSSARGCGRQGGPTVVSPSLLHRHHGGSRCRNGFLDRAPACAAVCMSASHVRDGDWVGCPAPCFIFARPGGRRAAESLPPAGECFSKDKVFPTPAPKLRYILFICVFQIKRGEVQYFRTAARPTRPPQIVHIHIQGQGPAAECGVNTSARRQNQRASHTRMRKNAAPSTEPCPQSPKAVRVRRNTTAGAHRRAAQTGAPGAPAAAHARSEVDPTVVGAWRSAGE